MHSIGISSRRKLWLAENSDIAMWVRFVMCVGAILMSSSTKGSWRSPQFGKWVDIDENYEGNLPGANDGVYHYGPTRVWTAPVHSFKYVISSKVLMKNGRGCGHIFKYKEGSTRSRRLVTKTWGYFFWANKYIYISSNGQESSPKIDYAFSSNTWYDLMTVVDGVKVTLFINGLRVKEITMTGSGAIAPTHNYVGLWCHRLAHCQGKDFKVVQNGWRQASFGTWTDTCSAGRTCCSFEGNMPGPSDAVYHYGPTRVWDKPIHSSKYEIRSKVLSKNGHGCGHVFKYKEGSKSTQKLVTKSWGYFIWSNKYMYISNNGIEGSPKINFAFNSNQWYDLRTVVDGVTVKIFINNALVQQVTITGDGSISGTSNYVGLWCHRLAHFQGKDFQVIQDGWREAQFGIWVDILGLSEGTLPGTDDSYYHYGPTRVWHRPVQSGRYEIRSKVLMKNGRGCGHIFRYKEGGTTAQKSVTKAWGYFPWANTKLYISSNGQKGTPSINFAFLSNVWYDLRTEVALNRVKIYINDKLVHTATITGPEAMSNRDNYVGLWCHRQAYVNVKDFEISQNGWLKPAQFGIWTDLGQTFEGNLPGSSDTVYHYGPTRVWATPIHSFNYVITSKLLVKNGKGCGHIFKYKKDSTRSKNLVTEGWGYFPWANSYLYISSNGQESTPRINYKFPSNVWFNLKTVVRGTNVKMYINNKFVHQLTISGEGSSSTTDNYVGLWCHRLAHVMGRDFKVVPQ